MLGFLKDEPHGGSGAAAVAEDEDEDEDRIIGDEDAPPRLQRGFSVQVPVNVERPNLGPFVVPCNLGEGGVQGSWWYGKRHQTLDSSPQFAASCKSVFDDCLTAAQHAFIGVRRLQLPDAVVHLHAALAQSLPLFNHWLPSSPSRSQIDAALKRMNPAGDDLTLDEFRSFAAELFGDAVMAAARRAMLVQVPVGITGIAGIGMAAQVGREVVGRVMGVYEVEMDLGF